MRLPKVLKWLGDPFFILWGGIGLLIIQAAFFGMVIAIARSLPAAEVSKSEWRGQFGDTFGALNTAFTGLAFIGLLHTAALQRRELEETRRQMDDAKKNAEAAENLQKAHLQESRQQTIQAKAAAEAAEVHHAAAELERMLLEVLKTYQSISMQYRGAAGPDTFSALDRTISAVFNRWPEWPNFANAGSDDAWVKVEARFQEVSNHKEGGGLLKSGTIPQLALNLQMYLTLLETGELSDASRERFLLLLRCQLSPSELAVFKLMALCPKHGELRRLMAKNQIERKVTFNWLAGTEVEPVIAKRFRNSLTELGSATKATL